MSLILDALNRSRQDAHDVPGLSTQHPVEPVERQRSQYLPWIALAVALVLVAWLLWDRNDSKRQESPMTDLAAPVAELSRNMSSAAEAVSSQLQSRAEAGRQNPVTAAPNPAAVKPAGQAAANTQPQPQPGQAPAAPAPAREAAAAVAAMKKPAVSQFTAAQDAAVAELYAESAVEPAVATPSKAKTEAKFSSGAQPAAAQVAESGPQEQTVDIEDVLLQAREEMGKNELMEHPAPMLSSLSQQSKDAIPTLLYQRHDYSDNRGQSSVVINGKTVKAGGSPAKGVKINEILPDSIVLTHGGTQFRLRALNSWVNL